MQIIHPAGPCRVIVADPPWQFGDKIQGNRGAEAKYACLSLSDIQRFPLPEFDSNAVLFLWRVAAMPDEALAVARAWGFEPKAEITWVKTNGQMEGGKPALDERGYPKLHMGMGHYTRAATEKALICTRGRFHVDDKGVRDTFFAPVGEHSEKPDEFFAIVERLTGPANRAELFGRKPRAGWLVVGNELPRLPDDPRPAGSMICVWTPPTAHAESTPIAAAKTGTEVAAAMGEVMGRVAGAVVDAVVAAAAGWVRAAERADASPDVEPHEPDSEHAVREVEASPVASHSQGAPSAGVVSAMAGGDSLGRFGVNDPPYTAPKPKAEPAGRKSIKLSPEQERKAHFVTKALEQKLISQSDVASEGLDGAFIKLQYKAPSDWFRENAPAGIEVLPSKIVEALAKVGVRTDEGKLLSLGRDEREAICAWINVGGGDVTKAPAALGAIMVRADAPADATGAGGCAGCDRGTPIEEAHKHTGTGPKCAGAVSGAKVEDAPAPKKGRAGPGRPKKQKTGKEPGPASAGAAQEAAVPSPQSAVGRSGWDAARETAKRAVDGEDAAV